VNTIILQFVARLLKPLDNTTMKKLFTLILACLTLLCVPAYAKGKHATSRGSKHIGKESSFHKSGLPTR